MGSSQRRKKRREALQLRASAAPAVEVPRESPPVLRLVRPEETAIPAEQVSAGCASPTIAPVRDGGRNDPHDPPQEVSSALGSSPAQEPDCIPLSLVRRSFDPADINPIINSPEVFPSVATPDLKYLDTTPILSDTRNVLLMADNGGLLFCQLEPHVYEVHTALTKPERGAHGHKGAHNQNVCRAAYRWMFTQTDCLVIHTRIPAFNRAAAIFAPLLGWVKEFERKAVWPTADGSVDMSFWSLRYEDWFRKTPELALMGLEFHHRLEEEFARHGRAGEQHPDEEIHDRAVGAAYEMLRAKQLLKAIFLYNRWARFAGYGCISLISEDPPTIDIGNAILEWNADTFKVPLVR